MSVPVIRHSHRILTAAALLGLIACKSSPEVGYKDVVDYTTPETSLSRYEYPFEKDGTYREDWAAGDLSRPDRSRRPALASNSSKKKEKEKKKREESASPLLASTSTIYQLPPELPAAAPAVRPPDPVRVNEPLSRPPSPVITNAGGGSTPPATVIDTSARPAPRPAAQPRRTTAASTSKPKAPARPKSTASRSHTVKRGDTLYSLSRRYGTSVAAIKKLNGMKSDVLITGRTVRVPQ